MTDATTKIEVEMIECPRCGGQGGEPGSNFGDHGWHSCHACSETGFVTKGEALIIEDSDARLAESLEREQRAMYDGYDPDDDADDRRPATAPAPVDIAWMDEEIPF